ncbi:uncharacterized protein [Takifugu rubripes]|uniref:uncharacterized protein n=1 Tax=Takifugu rubripes TaxID=31033 RepID=UPI0011460111|nr:uncharacterized protein LOC115246856 [Takifugu rubripes]
MGCSCSTSSDEWSDSDSDSSLSDFPTYVRRSKVTVEHRQDTTAGTQHACLDAELKGDSRGRCDEETLESHPHVALPRLSIGGEENTPDVSKPSKLVWSTPVRPPSVAFMVTEVSGDQQRPTVDSEPQRDDKEGEEVRLVMTEPHQAFKTKTHSYYSICSADTDDLEQEQNHCATDEPGPSTVLQTTLLPTPPPRSEPGLFPPPPPEPDTGLLPTPPPELSLSSEVNVRLTTVSSPDIGQETHRGSIKSQFDWQDNVELKCPWLPANSRVRKIPSRDEGDVRLTTTSSPDTVSCYHADVTTSCLNFNNPEKLYSHETRRRSNKSEFEWQDNAELQRPWLPANSRVWKIPSRDEGDGPSVPICFYIAPEDLPPPRPECQDAGTQTLPPGAGGDASTPSKIDSVCPEQRVMAEGGNSGVKTKGMVWSQGTPQAGFPQRGGRVDTPGPVSEPQPSKAQNCRPMLNRGLEQRSKTKADDQPAHPPGQQVGSKLTYAQVLMMPPRKRAPPPDLSPPYPEQEHQPAGTRRPIKLRYARL